MATVAHLELDEVSKTYASRQGLVEAVSDVSFTLKQNEFVSVLGPSGCGKSTILTMVAGLVPVSAGTIRIRGERVEKPHPQLGVVFQRDALLDWRTVIRNVMLQVEIRGLDADTYRERALELLDFAGLEGFSERYPYELSGGMRQRVSICRALVHRPELLLMDEPFGALDALTRERMIADLARLHERAEASILFITHSIPEAVLLSDRVIVMSARPGRVVDVLEVPLPRPRRLDMEEEPEFAACVKRIREQFQHQGVLRT